MVFRRLAPYVRERVLSGAKSAVKSIHLCCLVIIRTVQIELPAIVDTSCSPTPLRITRNQTTLMGKTYSELVAEFMYVRVIFSLNFLHEGLDGIRQSDDSVSRSKFMTPRVTGAVKN